MRLVFPAILIVGAFSVVPAQSQPAAKSKPAPQPAAESVARPAAAPAVPQATTPPQGGDAASPGHPGWITDAETSCRLWESQPKANETMRWTGPCAGGVAEGEGALVTFVDGAVVGTFRGMMREGRPEGHGVTVRFIGTSRTAIETYEGDFEDGYENGRGVLIDFQGARYEGTFHPSGAGRGVMVLRDGRRYEGQVHFGSPSGRGTLTEPGGQARRGVWEVGCLDDGGTLVAFGKTKAECESWFAYKASKAVGSAKP